MINSRNLIYTNILDLTDFNSFGIGYTRQKISVRINFTIYLT
ncbi:hypothetical protein LF25067_01611 [Limosilactobacillus fermentum]|nr:hypothetical protein LF25067_01611 [Limosilactobacillus fermentum]